MLGALLVVAAACGRKVCVVPGRRAWSSCPFRCLHAGGVRLSRVCAVGSQFVYVRGNSRGLRKAAFGVSRDDMLLVAKC